MEDPRIQKIYLDTQITWDAADKILRENGYSPHLKGWVKNLSKKKRLHIDLVKANRLELHMDTTIKGKHVLDFSDALLEEFENVVRWFFVYQKPIKERTADEIIIVKQLNSKERKKKERAERKIREWRKNNVFAPANCQRFSTVVRSKWNPLRYIIGKFKNIKK